MDIYENSWLTNIRPAIVLVEHKMIATDEELF